MDEGVTNIPDVSRVNCAVLHCVLCFAKACAFTTGSEPFRHVYSRGTVLRGILKQIKTPKTCLIHLQMLICGLTICFPDISLWI